MPPKSSDPQKHTTPDDRRSAILRWLYLPWAWLVFIPCVILLTFVLGVAAIILCIFSPKTAFHCATIWAWCLCKVNFTPVRLSGRHHASSGQSYVIMSNHQSHFDILAFTGYWRWQHRWVLKQELRKAPVLGWYCAVGGHIYVDRSNRVKAMESLLAAKQRLRDGVSVIIFPEGTRSPDGELQTFKRGGFVMARDLGLPILPVTIIGSRFVLPPRTLRPLPGTIGIQVHRPVDVTRHHPEQLDTLMSEVQNTIASGLSGRTDWD